MLGKNVVYVTGRCMIGPGLGGGTYHRPSHDHMTPWTRCGRELRNPVLMQRDWAEHTRAQACHACFGVRREKDAIRT